MFANVCAHAFIIVENGVVDFSSNHILVSFHSISH